MTDHEINALDGRVTRLEGQITAGFDELKSLLRQEIADLKNEQIAELRKQNERLGDDQRRLWERLVDMERRENRRAGDYNGQSRTLSAIGHVVTAIGGGIIGWLANWLSGGNPPPHH